MTNEPKEPTPTVIEQHLNEMYDIMLNGEEQGEKATEYLEAHGLEFQETFDAAYEFLKERKFVKNYGRGAAEMVCAQTAVPAFIIGMMIGLKHGITELDGEDFDLPPMD